MTTNPTVSNHCHCCKFLVILQFAHKMYRGEEGGARRRFMSKFQEKSRIRETKHLSTDADSSTDAIGGWTKNTPKPDFFLKNGKNHPKRKNSKMSRNMPKLAIRPSARGL